MKKNYQFFAFASMLLLSNGLFAQSDTLFFLNFQTDPSSGMAIFPDPGETDTMWVNYDEDGLDTNPGDPSNFWWDFDFEPDTAATDTNYVFMSQSYLVDFDTSSSNWLISPAMYIADNTATLHWKSAAFQGPRYLDGYAVKIMTDSQDPTTETPTEVFRAAEMLSWIETGDTLALSSFVFSNGYIHADGFTLTEYFTPANPDDLSPAHSPRLEPHSISLAQFAGDTIYVAFHHDSADDYYFEFDDLLLLGTIASSTIDPAIANLRFVTYPNPVDNFLNVMFRLNNPAEVQLEIITKDGKRVAAKAPKHSVTGDFTEQFDLRHLPSGAYVVVLAIDNQRFVKNIIRK
jgi:Secretion system C-terminal sorting domain